MKVTLYMDVSINGHITDSNGKVDWIKEEYWKLFDKQVGSADVVIMGRHTYEASKEDNSFPYGKDLLNIVLTSEPSLYKAEENSLFTNKPPKEIIEYLNPKEYENVLIIGGGITNARFLVEGVIDEIVLSVHPIILGKGIKIFNEFEGEIELELKNSETIDNNLVHLTYSVVK